MYGKIFSSLFTGSMYGAGSSKFAIMSYVIANMKPDKTVGFQVELNVKDLSNRIGEPERVIQEAVDFLCAPDPHSRTATEDGRRLVKIGTFDYQVVNGAHYASIRNEEDRRENNRARQAKHRLTKKIAGDTSRVSAAYMAGENANEKLIQSGASQETLDAHVTSTLPKSLQ